jgi:hypothetical protein
VESIAHGGTSIIATVRHQPSFEYFVQNGKRPAHSNWHSVVEGLDRTL